MGTWGAAILSNDLAQEIGDEWKELLGEGYSPEAITEHLIEVAENQGTLADVEDKYNFWLSLSLIQWKTGRLQTKIQKKALFLLDDSELLIMEEQRWKTKKDYERRIKYLEN